MTIQKKHLFGLEKVWLDEYFQASITDKECTLLDVFIYPKLFGGMGEALGILENTLTEINITKLVDYTIRYNKKSLAKRLGWALEYFKIPMSYYCRLDPSLSAPDQLSISG